ncbi:EAL domain-containing protein [Roseibium salinum]|nr:EAL domain-containing protein [Roseibium salinum]
MEAGLIKALKYDQFRLLYQPQYSLRDGELKGYEALIRWDHPEKGHDQAGCLHPGRGRYRTYSGDRDLGA